MRKPPERPPSCAPRARDRVTPAADAHLWRAVAASARPLKRKPGRALPPTGLAPEQVEEKPAPPAAPPKSPPKSPPAPALPSLHPGAAPGVDRNTAARLRKGELAIDATLDLHGMTQSTAHSALIGFIARARAEGRRCVLVVTGKGERADPDGRTKGILRQVVPRWLNEAPLRAHVLSFAQARPRHGGEGALYVLVRRVREIRR